MIDDAAEAYIRFYETMTPESLAKLDDLVVDDVWFRDPFNDVRGAEAMRRIFIHMFEHVRGPRFYVTHRAFDGRICFLRWRLVAHVRMMGNEPWTVEGVSEIHFDDYGRVTVHLDHWDAASQFYERLPVIGRVFRFIRSRAGHSSPSR